MKVARRNKVLGLTIGEHSLLIAELSAGDRANVRRLGEFVFPDKTSLDENPAALGKALGEYLQREGFSTRAVVVGLPARWLLVKSKELPPADAATAANLLRLQEEAESSAGLDLVVDYVGEPDAARGTTVLVVGAPRSRIASVQALCAAAGLKVLAITASALALAARISGGRDGIVLSVDATDAELTACKNGAITLLRRVGSADQSRVFVGELRRALSMLAPRSENQQLILWDRTGIDSADLAKSLDMPVRAGNAEVLNIDPRPGLNGQVVHHAAPIAVAMSGMDASGRTVDFLHSRLAPVQERRIPRWAIITAVATVLVIAAGALVYQNLLSQQDALRTLQARLGNMQGQIKSADAFVTTVSHARHWHAENPRYLACLNDLSAAFPTDGQTYAVSIMIRETMAVGPRGKAVATGTLTGQCYGKTSDQERFQRLLEQLKRNPAFTDVKLGGSQDTGRAGDVSFSITFTYRPAPAGLTTTREKPQVRSPSHG